MATTAPNRPPHGGRLCSAGCARAHALSRNQHADELLRRWTPCASTANGANDQPTAAQLAWYNSFFSCSRTAASAPGVCSADGDRVAEVDCQKAVACLGGAVPLMQLVGYGFCCAWNTTPTCGGAMVVSVTYPTAIHKLHIHTMQTFNQLAP